MYGTLRRAQKAGGGEGRLGLQCGMFPGCDGGGLRKRKLQQGGSVVAYALTVAVPCHATL